MEIDMKILPSNILNVRLKVRKKGKYAHSSVTIPPRILERYNLKDNDEIVLCFLYKSDEDIKNTNKE